MIRTHILPCHLPREEADALNLESGRIYSQVLVTHWRAYRNNRHWLSQYGAMGLNDWYNQESPRKLHAHTTDAAQQGFYKACTTTRALRKEGIDAKYPYHRQRFRTTIWKTSALKRSGVILTLSNARGSSKIDIALPESLRSCLRILEVRLVFEKRSRKYFWHLVAEDGQKPKDPPGDNLVSVDLGEIHPAVVGDEVESVLITCRELRHEKQGHAKRLASLKSALSRKEKNSNRYRKLIRTQSRLKGQHLRVVRDMEHKISRAIVDVAVERQAGTLVVGDVRDIADKVALGKKTNQKISQWSHGKIRSYLTYKAEAEGIQVELQDEAYTTQTCPQCGHRHKPRGRVYRCPACRFQSHRDVVGQINILSAFKYGEPGKIPAPQIIKHRIPHNLRVMRRCRDAGQVDILPVARGLPLREAAGL